MARKPYGEKDRMSRNMWKKCRGRSPQSLYLIEKERKMSGEKKNPEPSRKGVHRRGSKAASQNREKMTTQASSSQIGNSKILEV